VSCDIGLQLLVSARFQGLFHSPPGVLFSFRSRYSFTIGLSGVFRLRAWSPQVHAGFHGSCVTQEPARATFATRTGLSPSVEDLSRSFRSRPWSHVAGPTTPAGKPAGLASSVVARRYWRNLMRFLLLWLLRCFNSPGLLPLSRSRILRGRLSGLPHSDIQGSQLRCSSPRLFAA
jgi:hypothetical protein